jgi:polyprenyldihydroxybenzoate methyltransferase / 3-demethylubiquinol 3-O-methyltransferase
LYQKRSDASSCHGPRRSMQSFRHVLHPHLVRRALQTQAHSTLASSNGSINASEVAHFSRLSSLWWDEHGEFGLLHKMNPIRMQFITEKLMECAMDDGEDGAEERGVLNGKDVLDVGCGGGLLSEVKVSCDSDAYL